MAITKLNNYTVGDIDLTAMVITMDKIFKGLCLVTLSAYDTTAAPDVKVGSIFENNGTFFIVDTSDITPTSYAGISNSTTFYLYYNVSGAVFIYSATAPTWSDSKQGWYNGNDRAFFSMYKDSGGTLYQNKIKLSLNGDFSKRTFKFAIGDWNMDTSSQVSISGHGLEITNIRSATGMIIRDNSAVVAVFGGGNTGGVTEVNIAQITATNITLSRLTGGLFDSVDYDSTSFNRGYVLITVEG